MNGRRNALTSSLIFLGSVLVLTVVMSSTAWAKKKDKEESPVYTGLANLKMVRRLENQDVLTAFDQAPGLDEGVAFPPGANIVVKLDPPPGADRRAEAADVRLLRRGQSDKAEIVATIEIPDPINTAFNSTDRANVSRLFFYEATTSELIGIKINQNFPDTGSITRFDAAAVGVSNPQGMTLDGDRDTLYILDVSDGPDLVVIKIDKLESQALKGKDAKRRDLSKIVGQHGNPRCIAFNPQNSHLYLFNPGTEEIIELTTNGKLVDRREVDLDLTDLKGCIFARSSDGTDKPSLFNLFIATGGSPSGEVTEWSLN